MTTQYTVAELLDMFGKTPSWLIKKTKLSPGTIYRNLDDSPEYCKTHETVASAIADAFGIEVCEIKWPRGISDLGRHAYTGKSNLDGNTTERVTTEFTVTVTVKKTVTTEALCPIHNLILSISGSCVSCE